MLASPSRIAIRAAVATTLVAVVLVGWKLLGASNPPVPNLMCVTPGCPYRVRRELRVGEVLPLRCPQCNHRSVFGTHVCKECGTAVVLNRQRGIDLPTYCPRCGREVTRGH